MHSAIRCAVMLPESNESLRKAGACDHHCSEPPRFTFDTRVAGVKVEITLCERHRAQILRIIAERRIESRKQVRETPEPDAKTCTYKEAKDYMRECILRGDLTSAKMWLETSERKLRREQKDQEDSK